MQEKTKEAVTAYPARRKRIKKRGYDNVFLTEIRQFLAKVSAPYSNICAPPPIWSTRKRYNHPSTEEWHTSHYLLQLLLLNLGCGIKGKYFLTIVGGRRGKEKGNTIYYSSCTLTVQNFEDLALLIFFEVSPLGVIRICLFGVLLLGWFGSSFHFFFLIFLGSSSHVPDTLWLYPTLSN